MQKITSGNGAEEDLTRLRNLAMVIKDTALCGLGQTSPNPVLSTMDNFYDEYLAHVREHRCPSHQCRELTQYFTIRRNVKDVRLCARVCPVLRIRWTENSSYYRSASLYPLRYLYGEV